MTPSDWNVREPTGRHQVIAPLVHVRRTWRGLIPLLLAVLASPGCAPPAASETLRSPVADTGPSCSVDNTVVPSPSVSPQVNQPASGHVVDTIPVPPAAVWSTVASGEEAGLSVTIDLPQTAFLAGEAVSAHLVVRNGGPSPVFILDPSLVVIDETGQQFRHQGFGPGDGPITHPGPGAQQLDPGQSWTVSQAVQLPFEDDARQHTYQMQGRVQHAPQIPLMNNTARWAGLDTSTWTLPLALPSPAQHLRATLQVDGGQWCLQATDGVGGRPATPLSAGMRAGGRTDLGLMTLSGPGPVWTGSWAPPLMQSGGPITVQAWVAGPGYVTAQLRVP